MRWTAWSLLLTLLSAPLAAQTPGRGGWRLPDRVRPQEPATLPWDLKAAAHLMRRAGFSASPEELQRTVQQGFDKTLDELLNFEQIDDSAMTAGLNAKGYQLTAYNEELKFYVGNLLDMQRTWLYRMVHSRRQLLEKMTLFWHDHFATSFEGVVFANPNRGPLMHQQNETLRAHALGNFRQMLYAVAADPAMVVWLNNYENRVGSPNENWARELMELFTLGEGNGYTEVDVQEAARAFTGWSLDGEFDFAFYPFFHDFQPKTVLGQRIEYQTGDAGMADGFRVIDILLEQPAAAEFIARKVWEYFVYPDPSPQVVTPLADAFRNSDYDLRVLMRAVFEHPRFMSEKAYRAKIKSPVEYAVGACRELGVADPDNLPIFMFFFDLGQLLFLPPDVGGWPRDANWINTGTILARYNLLTIMTSKRPDLDFTLPGDDVIAVERIAQENDLRFAVDFVDYFVRALVQDDVSVDTRYTLEQYMNAGEGGRPAAFDSEDPTAVDKKVRGLIFLVALLPAYQLN